MKIEIRKAALMQAHTWLRTLRCTRSLAAVSAPVAFAASVIAACASAPGTDDPPTGETSASLSAPSGTSGIPPVVPVPPVPPTPHPECDGGSSTDQGYFSCDEDIDCEAVPLFSNCCYNGWKIAVARCEAAAYLAATECHNPRQACPLYIVLDERVPVCNQTEHQCILVQPDAGTSPINPANL